MLRQAQHEDPLLFLINIVDLILSLSKDEYAPIPEQPYASTCSAWAIVVPITADRAYPPSFFRSSSLTSFGLALPWVSFIT
jgi:hypothetical protein